MRAQDPLPPADNDSPRSIRLVRPDVSSKRPALSLPRPPALANGPDAGALWRGFCRRWPQALVVGALLAGVALALVYWLVPQRYKGFTLLQVASTRPSLEGQEFRADFMTYLRTQASRIKSREVLMKALNQEQVRNLDLVQKHPDTLTTLAWLEENLRVETADGSEMVEINLMGEDPNELVVMVGALAKSYLAIISNQEKTLRNERVSKMKMLVQQAKDRLSEKVAAREAVMNGQGAKDAPALLAKQQSVMGQLNRVQDQYQQLKFDMDKKDVQLAALEASYKSAASFTLPDTALREFEAAPLLQQDTAKLRALEQAIEHMEVEGHPPTDSTLRQFKGNAAKLRKQIDEQKEQMRQDYEKKMRARFEDNYQIARNGLGLEIIPLKNMERTLRDRIDTLTKEAESTNQSNSRRMVLDSEIDQAESSLEQLAKGLQKLQVEQESENRVTPVGEAEYQILSARKRTMLLIAAPISVFCLLALMLAWVESSARRIHSPEEVANGLSLHVVGTVPILTQPDAKAAASHGHNLVESIDHIRTMLMRSARNELTRTVLVTSAVSGEGKTTLASNLAISLARVGKKTLLMDCDLRGPAVHQLFEQPLSPGFSEALLGEVPLQDVVRPTNEPNLWVLPAGHWDREVVQELAKTGLESIFERLKEGFDFILLDSHPILAANDALLIGQQVDAVILSLMRDRSQADHVYQACQKLASMGIEVFGTVINGVPVKDYPSNQKYATQEAVAQAK